MSGISFLPRPAAVDLASPGPIGGTTPAAGTFTALTVTPSGEVQNALRVNHSDGTARIQMGVLPAAPTVAAIYLGAVTPSVSNYILASTGADSFLNATTSFSIVVNSATRLAIDADGLATFANLVSAPNVQLNHSTLTYGASVALDFAGNGFQTVTLTGVITFTTSNLSAGRSKTIRIIGDSSERALTFPGTWKFVGAAAPATLAANKVAVLTLTSFGTTDANVIAAYAAEP